MSGDRELAGFEAATADLRPKISPYFVPVRESRNEIHFRVGPWSGPVYTVRDADEEGRLASVVELLDGKSAVSDIVEALPENSRVEILKIIQQLHELNVLYFRDQGEEPTLNHFAMERDILTERPYRLSGTTISVITNWRTDALFTNFLSDLGIDDDAILEVDADSLERSNNDGRAIETGPGDGELSQAVRAADLVLYVTDNPQPAVADAINLTALETGTPWISGQLYGLTGIVGPAFIPGETCCYECFRRRVHANSPPGSHPLGCESLPISRDDWRLQPLRYIVAGHLLFDTMNLLTSGFGFTVGNAMVFDFFDLSVESNQVLKLPRCPACGNVESSHETTLLNIEHLIEEMSGLDEA